MNYDIVAPAYDRRYERHRFDGIQAVLERFVGGSANHDAAEVGCGTGHWLARVSDRVRSVAGVDPSAAMLARARAAEPRARLVRGRAEALPWRTEAFDRLFCVNALHHFADAPAFLREAHRVLRPGGALGTIGLDPHMTVEWWIYDYFPGARERDLARYLAAGTIRAQMRAAGFANAATELAQHIRAEVPFAAALERGLLDRRSTSQLMVMGNTEYHAGLARLHAEQPVLRADLRLYATAATAGSTGP